jgi:hypothetical protein
MQEKVTMPEHEAGALDGPQTPPANRIVRHLRQIVLWPFQILSAHAGNGVEGCESLFEKAAAGGPWRPLHDVFAGEDGELQERHYREFISFLPHAQRFLYGEAARTRPQRPDDIPMKVYKRNDIKQVRVTADRGAAPIICDVVHIHLHFFYEMNVAILACEFAADDIALDAAQNLTQKFGRAYPAGWTSAGDPIHCAALVEWLDGAGAVLASSDYDDKKRYLDFVGAHRAPCIARHWEFVLAPIVNAAGDAGGAFRFREIEYYRMPVMSFLTVDSLDALTQKDYIALALATRPAKTGIVPFSQRFLKRFEAEHVYDRLYSGGLDAPEIETRFLTSGEALTVVSAGESPSLIDNERGLLGQFRHQYFLAFLIAHFHKASLLMFADRLVATLKNLDPAKSGTAAAFREETLRLQEGFLRFSQRYFFAEISGRAHVRDLFRMMRKHLNIEGLFAEVRSELFDLVKYLDSAVLRKQNRSMHRLTVVTIVGLVGTIVTGFLGMNLIAEAEAALSYKIEFFVIVSLAVSLLVALAVIYSRPLTDLLERLSGEKR